MDLFDATGYLVSRPLDLLCSSEDPKMDVLLCLVRLTSLPTLSLLLGQSL